MVPEMTIWHLGLWTPARHLWFLSWRVGLSTSVQRKCFKWNDSLMYLSEVWMDFFQTRKIFFFIFMEQRKVFMMYCIQMYNTRHHHQAHQHQHHHHDQMVSESEVLCQSDDDQQNINQQYQQSRYILPDGKRFRYADDVVQGDFLGCKYMTRRFLERVFFRIVAKCLDWRERKVLKRKALGGTCRGQHHQGQGYTCFRN